MAIVAEICDYGQYFVNQYVSLANICYPKGKHPVFAYEFMIDRSKKEFRALHPGVKPEIPGSFSAIVVDR
jgi:hypothetical protein